MADYNASRQPDTSKNVNKKKDWAKVLKAAKKRWDRSMQRERENIRLAYDDLSFLAGDELSQWDPLALKARKDRPTLQMNELPQFVHQVTGDMRQMKPALKFVPVDNGSDEKVADYYGGLSRYIENRSMATSIYARGADSQVACGIGGWRVQTEYADDTTFNQELRIAPLDDAVAVLWDPDSILPDRSDAKFCFVPVDMSMDLFEEEYPDVSPASFDDDKWSHNTTWCTDDYVRVAEYWTRKPMKRIIALTPQGGTLDLTDEPDPKAAAELAKQHGARVEERDSYKLCRYLITAMAVLEEADWPGRLIPIVPLVGEEIRIGRKIVRKGLVRDAKDPQRMVNYFHSAHTELIALQPKAPWVVTETNVAKYQGLWETANTENQPYLVFEPDTKNAGAAPQRAQPPVSSPGVVDGLRLSMEALRAVTGIYDPSLGNKSNETSGKAIEARQREGDTGSVLYLDNFVIAIQRTGQILADLIPKIYDTERTIRIMGEDGKIDKIEINKAEGLGETAKIINDVTTGSYDVVCTVGPSYSTKRQEAKEGMISFVQAAPETAPLILDLVAQAQDWPMADDIAKRLRTMLPPPVLAMEEAEKNGQDPEQARQQAMQQNQPPPDPQMLKVQADAEHNKASLEFEAHKAASDEQQAEEQRKMQLEIEQAKIAEQARQADAQIASQERIKMEEIASQERIALFKEQATAEHNKFQAENQDKSEERQAALQIHSQEKEHQAKAEDTKAKHDVELKKTAMPLAHKEEGNKKLEGILAELTKTQKDLAGAIKVMSEPSELEVIRSPGQPTVVRKRKGNGANA